MVSVFESNTLLRLTDAQCSMIFSNKRNYRFESCKIPSLTSAALALVGSILIFLRWRYVYLRWEVGYTILLCVGLGGLSSTQYIALAGRASGNSASVITSYHVCQQIGTIIGNEYPVALLMRNFRDQLVKSFGHNPEGQEVSILDHR